MNRGSKYGRITLLVSAGRFNEAPIHESGKWKASQPPLAPDSRFNEAPIHESGKWSP